MERIACNYYFVRQIGAFVDSELPLVSVVCITYNHEKYIRQALDGFVMQQCSFPIEIIVHDDASTDNTVNIINEYLEKCSYMRAIFQKENQYSREDFDRFESLYKKETRGKYIAVCEGDDYWTDPLKLEKQILFLEANSDYGMSYTKAKYYIQKENKYTTIIGGYLNTFDSFILRKTWVPTLTVVMRKKLLAKYYDEIRPREQKWLLGDLPKWLWFVKNSKIQFEDCVTGVYRVLPESVSNTKNAEKKVNFFKSCINVREYFINKYGVEDRSTLYEFLFMSIWETFRYACILNNDRLFKEVQRLIGEKNKMSCLRLLYIRLVLFCKPMRYLWLICLKIRYEYSKFVESIRNINTGIIKCKN